MLHTPIHPCIVRYMTSFYVLSKQPGVYLLDGIRDVEGLDWNYKLTFDVHLAKRFKSRRSALGYATHFNQASDVFTVAEVRQ